MGEDSEEEESEEEEESDSDDEPPTAEQFKELGNAKYKQKDYGTAITCYTKAIELAPDVPTYRLNRASAYMMKLQYAEAVADCDAAIALDENLAKAYFRKGKALLSKGDPQNAVAAITTGLIKEPGNAAALADRKLAEECSKRIKLAGQCLGKQEYVQVWKQLQIVEKHMSFGPDITMMKIEALACIGKASEAYALTNSMMRSNSRYPGLLFWRAKSLYYMDQVPSAIKHLQEAMRDDPDNSNYRTEIKKWKSMEKEKEAGNEAFKGSRFQEAIDRWTQCLGVDPQHRTYNAKLYLNRATAYSKLRDHEKAVADCGEALKLDDKYIKAYNRRAESLRVLGEKSHLEQAIRDVQKMMEIDSEANKKNHKQKLRELHTELKRAGREDLYKIMGVRKDATEAEIKKQYKKQALKWHPDRHSTKSEEEQKAAAEEFQKINRAMDVLGDTVKRKKYVKAILLNTRLSQAKY